MVWILHPVSCTRAIPQPSGFQRGTKKNPQQHGSDVGNRCWPAGLPAGPKHIEPAAGEKISFINASPTVRTFPWRRAHGSEPSFFLLSYEFFLPPFLQQQHSLNAAVKINNVIILLSTCTSASFRPSERKWPMGLATGVFACVCVCACVWKGFSSPGDNDSYMLSTSLQPSCPCMAFRTQVQYRTER